MNKENLLDPLFIEGRTHRFFTNKPVEDNLLRELYEIAKTAPSASNLCPMRITFVTSDVEKQKVIDAAADGNKAKIQSAPVVAIIAYDTAFYNYVEQLAPHMNAEAFRSQEADKLEMIGVENSWFQAGFFILAARAVGLDCGPMSGFNKSKIDEAFYSETTWRSHLLINLGYGDETKLHPRGARLDFDEACSIL